jgi:hypothetical protein
MPVFTLIEIINFATVGGSHLSGEAIFSDGKRYRFVIENGTVDRMCAPNESGDFKPSQYRTPFPMRAVLISQAYAPYLERAREEKKNRDAEYLAECDKRNKAAIAERNLQEAAPKLLALLRAVLDAADDETKATGDGTVFFPYRDVVELVAAAEGGAA